MAQSSSNTAFEFKGSMFTLPVLLLHSVVLEELRVEMESKCAQAPGFFVGAPIVLDLGQLAGDQPDPDFPALIKLMRECGMVPVGVRQANEHQQAAAKQAGFAVMQGGGSLSMKAEEKVMAVECKAAMLVDKPVRSGQQIYAKGSDLIITAHVSEGAEVIADGNIHVYGALRGRALAGVQGNEHVRIFSQSMEAELVSIAGQYLLLEDQNRNVKSKAAQVLLTDGSLMIQAL